MRRIERWRRKFRKNQGLFLGTNIVQFKTEEQCNCNIPPSLFIRNQDPLQMERKMTYPFESLNIRHVAIQNINSSFLKAFGHPWSRSSSSPPTKPFFSISALLSRSFSHPIDHMFQMSSSDLIVPRSPFNVMKQLVFNQPEL